MDQQIDQSRARDQAPLRRRDCGNDVEAMMLRNFGEAS